LHPFSFILNLLLSYILRFNGRYFGNVQTRSIELSKSKLVSALPRSRSLSNNSVQMPIAERSMEKSGWTSSSSVPCTGVLSALWSQSFCLAATGTLVLQGGEEKRATGGGRAIRNRTVLRFGLVVLLKEPDYPRSPRMHVPMYPAGAGHHQEIW